MSPAQGVLNVWHLVHYQRFYNSLVAQLVPTAEQASQSLVARVRILTQLRSPAVNSLDFVMDFVFWNHSDDCPALSRQPPGRRDISGTAYSCAVSSPCSGQTIFSSACPV